MPAVAANASGSGVTAWRSAGTGPGLLAYAASFQSPTHRSVTVSVDHDWSSVPRRSVPSTAVAQTATVALPPG